MTRQYDREGRTTRERDTRQRGGTHSQSMVFDDMPSATNRAWGESRDPGDQSFGTREQGGWGDFREPGGGKAPVRDLAHARDFPSQRGRGPRNYTRSDARIQEDVSDRLTEDDRVDASQVLVSTENGVVTLTGEVGVRWMKHCAEDIAALVTGVRDVENRIRVDDGSASFGPPGRAVRSGRDQRGSAFSSSSKVVDAARGSEANWPEDQALPAQANPEDRPPR